jgi:hypothetical protein
MEFIELNKRPNFEADRELAIMFTNFEDLIFALQKKEIPTPVMSAINQEIEQVNVLSGANI